MMEVHKIIFEYIGIFYILYLIGYATFLFLAVVVGTSTLYNEKMKEELENKFPDKYYIPISVIVPAYNEAVSIKNTIDSLMSLDYPLFEIIVVDDGSKDNTSNVIIEDYKLTEISRPIRYQLETEKVIAVYESSEYKVPLTLIKKNNGGKADALNVGINASKFPYFVGLDADSVLQRDSLKKIIKPALEQNNVVAIGGAIRPSNDATILDGKIVNYKLPKKILPAMQVLEYDRTFLAAKILFDKFNGNIIISGAFGLFKKDVVIAVGGYDRSTMGEDMELVVKLHVFCRQQNIDYSIRYVPDAICWTQAPESLADLSKQRRRWHIGLFQCMTAHKNLFANYKYGMVGVLSYLYFLIYELLSPYIEVFGVITVIIAYFIDLINISFMISLFVIYLVYSAILSLTAFFATVHTNDLHLRFRDILKAIFLCIIELSCLRFVMSWVRTGALFGYKRKKNQWGSIKRKKIDIR